MVLKCKWWFSNETIEAEDIQEEESDEEDDIPTHDGWNHRWGCPPLSKKDLKQYKK